MYYKYNKSVYLGVPYETIIITDQWKMPLKENAADVKDHHTDKIYEACAATQTSDGEVYKEEKNSVAGSCNSIPAHCPGQVL